VVFSISRRKGAGRGWQEGWPSIFNSNWGKHCCCCRFGQKLPSNRIKNNKKIFSHPQDCSFSDSEIGVGKEKVVCTFCSTLLDTRAKGWSSHILLRHYRDGRCRQKKFNKIITGDEPWCFAYDSETKQQGSESPRSKKLKFQWSTIQTMLIMFFDSQGVVHKEFVPEGEKSKYRVL